MLRRACAVAVCALLTGCMHDLARSLRRGELLYRIEYRPERVCVPEKPWGRYVAACVRALDVLGGGVIEVL